LLTGNASAFFRGTNVPLTTKGGQAEAQEKMGELALTGGVTLDHVVYTNTNEGIDGIAVDFEIEIDGSGLLTTRYRVHAGPSETSTSGVAYLLPAAIDKLSWHRDSLWSVYPEDHIGRPKGVALKKASHSALAYRARPEWSWSEDMEDPFLWGKDGATSHATNDFRSLKENIWYAACTLAGSQVRARAEANADVAVRASVLPDGRVSFSLYNEWSYPGLGWGNYTGSGAAPAQNSREVRLRLTDLHEEQS
jgi:hypothetical protein